jgi:hypothetical protein
MMNPAAAGATMGLAPAILSETPPAAAPTLLWLPQRLAKSNITQTCVHTCTAAAMMVLWLTWAPQPGAQVCHPAHRELAARGATQTEPETKWVGPHLAPNTSVAGSDTQPQDGATHSRWCQPPRGCPQDEEHAPAFLTARMAGGVTIQKPKLTRT